MQSFWMWLSLTATHRRRCIRWGRSGVAAGGVYIPPTPIDYVSVTHPNSAACAALLSRCTLTCLALAEDPPLAIACELACSATYLVCNNLCASRCTP